MQIVDKGFYVITHFLRPLCKALLQEMAFELAIVNQGVNQRQKQISLQLGRKGRGLVQIRAAEDSLVHMDVLPCGQQPHKRAAQ